MDLDLRNSEDMPETGTNVRLISNTGCSVLDIPVIRPSSSLLLLFVVFSQPIVSSSAMTRPADASFLLRFLDFLSGFESAVK